MDGEERELMLFTNGFLLCRVDLNVQVNILLDVSSGRIQQKRAQLIQDQCDHGRDISENGGETAMWLGFECMQVCIFLCSSD